MRYSYCFRIGTCRRLLLLSAALFSAAACVAPASAQAPGEMPPEVLPDHRVVFRISAPKATEVAVSGDWITQGRGTGGAMQKDAQGIWSLTVGPLVPDFYSYSLTVDGVRAQVSRLAGNFFEVPGEENAFQENRRVPHGDVHRVWYFSETLGQMRRMHVYTPPGYGVGSGKYPVLYLIHGGGDDDTGWSNIGRAGFILDNLIAAGKAKPMIVVMPNGSISLPGISTAVAPEDRQNPTALTARIVALSKLHDTFVEDLLKGIIPHIDKNFRVLAQRENRAIAGLSMGGAETLRVAPTHLELFSHIGVFSMGLQTGYTQGVASDFEQRNAKFLSDREITNKLLKLFWIGVGSNDRTVFNGPKLLSETLTLHGIKHEYHETEGGHTWINWRHYLNDYAQLLFH
jgi:enterochelin esterase-like enzyme